MIRIIRQKGFVEEKELTKFSLLPQRNLRVILSRLMCEGIVETQDMPQNYKGTGPMYGLNSKTLDAVFRERVAQAALNYVTREGAFG